MLSKVLYLHQEGEVGAENGLRPELTATEVGEGQETFFFDL